MNFGNFDNHFDRKQEKKVKNVEMTDNYEQLIHNLNVSMNPDNINDEIERKFLRFKHNLGNVTENNLSNQNMKRNMTEYEKILKKILATNIKLNLTNQVYFSYFQQILDAGNEFGMKLEKIGDDSINNLNDQINRGNLYEMLKPQPIINHNYSYNTNIIPNDYFENNNGSLINCKRSPRFLKKNTKCPHTEARHYAKNMCSNCYHSRGRKKKAWRCPHPEKSHYALGVCQNCYQASYAKTKKSEDNNSLDHPRECSDEYDKLNLDDRRSNDEEENQI